MTYITAENLIELLLIPMTDDKMVETLDALGIEQPVIDEQYEMDLYISIGSKDKTGVSFRFEELDGYTQEGEPCLVKLSFNNEAKISFPFDLKEDDNYSVCCDMLGSRADYINPNMEDAKIWLKETLLGKKYTLTALFWDEDLEELRAVTINRFDESRLGDTLLENKE
jgi:hypothetical protein